jgi:hypothetical protein
LLIPCVASPATIFNLFSLAISGANCSNDDRLTSFGFMRNGLGSFDLEPNDNGNHK